MGKRLLAALCAVLMSFFLPSPAPPDSPGGTARCLAVGMDLFVTRETTEPCSANNAEIMAALFAAYLPEGTRITRRVNGPGGAAELSRLILDAFSGAGREDTSFLYLSTHGETWVTEDGDSLMTLILSDGTREEAISAEALRTMMDRIPGEKVLILDCCHAGAAAEAFSGPDWAVIAGCGAEEECYFQSAGKDTGTGYFTTALENALRAAEPWQIDPDGDGNVSLKELAARIREIYGVSTPAFVSGDEDRVLFRIPENRKAPERLLGIEFDPPEEEDGQITFSFRFRTETAVKLEYRLVPAGENGWDFDSAVRLPDRERTGSTRGLLSPGEKTRSIRVSRERLGETGRALLQVISLRGLRWQVPVPEATIVICDRCYQSSVRNFDSCSIGLVTQIGDLDKSANGQ